ncbi:hypothetical protein [Methanocella arvoryzae]|nr:hypothetical protein [Methanocella arvoryzae]
MVTNLTVIVARRVVEWRDDVQNQLGHIPQYVEEADCWVMELTIRNESSRKRNRCEACIKNGPMDGHHLAGKAFEDVCPQKAWICRQCHESFTPEQAVKDKLLSIACENHRRKKPRLETGYASFLLGLQNLIMLKAKACDQPLLEGLSKKFTPDIIELLGIYNG